MADYGSLPFAEALAYLRAKLALPAKRWDDLLGATHDRAFVVAGAMQADLLAVLDAELRRAMDAAQPVVVLSRESVEAHRHHPEVSAADYALAQRILDEGELYEQGPGRIVALWRVGDKLYRAALKRTGDKEKNYWLTLFLTDEGRANREVRDKFDRIR
jgi:hypothetical protein